MGKKPLPQAAKAHRQRLRRDPFGRACIAVADYLESEGWSVVLFGGPRVQVAPPGARKSNFEFVLRFTGSRKTPAPAPGETP